jgi:ATP-dependent DNA helicase RecQ
VDALTNDLCEDGINAQPYHAGLSSEKRRSTQEAFDKEECDVVVATIAFGMGIDRSNVRYVLHTAMPKSVEHYQQETGRAGRDGLEAECVLLHSGADVLTWKSILEKSASEPGIEDTFLPNAIKHLNDMDRYCRGGVCRHRALVQYFGQEYISPECGACDICLGDAESVPDAQVVAQKILSCVARIHERFGIGHTVAVLRGERSENVQRHGHEKLSTFGLLSRSTIAAIREWIYQLIGQQVLRQEDITLPNGKCVPILRLTDASWEVMRGTRAIRLVQPVRRRRNDKPRRSRTDTISWEGVDRDLFDALRNLRRRLAEERNWQPYMVFSDATLREMARRRPSTLEELREVYGVGASKLRDFGSDFLQIILDTGSAAGED